MSQYLLIESRDSFAYGDVGYFHNMAKDLAASGNDVTLFLVQNGVLMARQGIAASSVPDLARNSKIQVLADDFCLKERGIQAEALVPGVKVSSVDSLVDLLAGDGVKAVWH